MSHTNPLGLTSANAGRAKPGLRSLLTVVVVAAALAGAVIYRVAGATSSHAASSAHYTYGGLPSWLPHSTLPTNRVLAASASHPQMAIEGDVVKVALPTGNTVVTLTGPQVPPFVAPPPPYTTATLTISFKDSSGLVPLRVGAFALIDGNGTIFHPTAFVGGATSVHVPDHSALAVQIREYMAIGSGSIRWAPARHPVVTWEFTVEND